MGRVGLDKGEEEDGGREEDARKERGRLGGAER